MVADVLHKITQWGIITLCVCVWWGLSNNTEMNILMYHVTEHTDRWRQSYYDQSHKTQNGVMYW